MNIPKPSPVHCELISLDIGAVLPSRWLQDFNVHVVWITKIIFIGKMGKNCHITGNMSPSISGQQIANINVKYVHQSATAKSWLTLADTSGYCSTPHSLSLPHVILHQGLPLPWTRKGLKHQERKCCDRTLISTRSTTLPLVPPAQVEWSTCPATEQFHHFHIFSTPGTSGIVYLPSYGAIPLLSHVQCISFILSMDLSMD